MDIGRYVNCGLYRFGLLLGLGLSIQGCATDTSTLKSTSASPDTPWAADGAVATAGDFSVPANPEVGRVDAGIQSGEVYGLPELIDLAQRNNPSTRIAWEQARQAALAVGVTEAAFLPVLTANVIGGVQDIVTPLSTVITTESDLAANLVLQWLVFDFGQRQALKQVAEQNAYSANVIFNGSHQTLIYNVTRSYYQFGAAQNDLPIAKQALANSQDLQDAANARFANGTGTSIEIAQAKQLVAQSKLRLVIAQDGLRDSYQDLLGAVGISPKSHIKISSSSSRKLPRATSVPTDQLIEDALARRPDVLASYAAVKASQAGERAADAEFKPKVYVSAIAGTGGTSLQTGNLTSEGSQATATGALIGISIPVYDGGIRDARRRQAQSATAIAKASFEETRNTAIREIIVASDTLRSALEVYAAASELTDAAQITNNAAFDAYKNGIGTITDATVAWSGLLDAEQSKSQAHAASLIAASTLAFSLGTMTSRMSPGRLLPK